MPQGPLDDKSILHRSEVDGQAPNTRYAGHLMPGTQHMGGWLCKAWGLTVRTRLGAVVFLGIPRPARARLRGSPEPVAPGRGSRAEVMGEIVEPADHRVPALLPP